MKKFIKNIFKWAFFKCEQIKYNSFFKKLFPKITKDKRNSLILLLSHIENYEHGYYHNDKKDEEFILFSNRTARRMNDKIDGETLFKNIIKNNILNLHSYKEPVSTGIKGKELIIFKCELTYKGKWIQHLAKKCIRENL